ncbi:HU family DNA-binding protein [Bacillus sp. FJAT-49705]|uniref:HU family DNA-binding protein n=1 Tax=Cytobacillus citreus TaxID=2833586 RepID=A0ABS5NS31_9BACI|nr:HU family DNA-binding protein [Cytobacillus citreus]MBS4189948.1 HU family DNA-binding protein [Cytobacillus citreus]
MSTGKEDNTQHNTQQEKQNTLDDCAGNVRNQNDIEIMASKATGVHKDTVKTVFNAMWDAICEELENGNEVKLHGKGSFYLSKRSSRIGRNPLTGEEFDVPEREAMAFQTSPAYARRLRRSRKALSEQDKNKE